MKIAVFPAGNAGMWLYQMLCQIEDVEVAAFVDNNPNRLGKREYETEIISPWKLRRMIAKSEVDLVLVASARILSYSLDELISQLDELEINHYKIVPVHFFRKQKFGTADLNELREIIFSAPYKTINQLQHLQFHVMDNCNLNCRRCQHFSNLVEKDTPSDFEKVARDFERIRKLFDNINVIAILGGEPLLNHELHRYCSMIRQLFPYSVIQIVTNGLLIQQMPENLKQTIRDHNIRLFISYYPVLSERIDDIVSYLRREEIQFRVGNRITSFSRKLVVNEAGERDVDQVFKLCRDRCCTTLRDGKLFPCYLPATIQYFNDRFGFAIGEGNSSNAIDLYDENISGLEIVSRLKRGFDICRYCGAEELYDWEQSKSPVFNDWII